MAETQAAEIERLKQENFELRYDLEQTAMEESKAIGWMIYKDKYEAVETEAV